MSVFRRLQYGAVVLALALVAAACGGGGEDTADTTTTTGGGDTTTTTTVATTTTTTTTTSAVSGDSGSSWCEDLRKAQEEDGEDPFDFDVFNLTPDEIEARLERALELFEDWAKNAPPEIDEDVDVLVGFFERFVEAGNAVDWQLAALANNPEFQALAQDPDLEAAADRIDAYNRDVCGVDLSETADPGTDDPITIALNAFQLPAGLFSEEDVECMKTEVGPDFIAGISPDWVPSTEDITVLLAAIETCGISLG